MQLKLPFEIKDLDPKLCKGLYQDFSMKENDGFVQVGPQKWFLPMKYKQWADKYYNFKVRPDDIWIVGMPRSGTTLTEEMVWLIANDLDYEKAKRTNSYKRIPTLENNLFVNDERAANELASPETDEIRKEFVRCQIAPLEILEDTKERRVIKTHLAFELLPPDLLKTAGKIVYIARNPKDVMASFFNFHSSIKTRTYVGSFENYFHYFKNAMIPFTPYWSLIEQGWTKRHLDNVYFMFYEDLNRDMRNKVEDVAKFLGKNYESRRLDELTENLQFDNFKKLRVDTVAALKYMDFIRKGKVGDYQNYFTGGLSKEADDWIAENVRRIGIKYPTY